MKPLNKSISTVLAAAFALMASTSAFAQDNELKPFFALDLSKPVVGLSKATLSTQGLSSQQGRFEYSYTPTLNLGLAKSFQLDDNWQLTTEAYVSYANSSFETTVLNSERTYGQFKEVGLWTSAKLKHTTVFDGFLPNAAPFIKVSAGVVDADYRFANQHFNDVVTGYKVSTGIEFELADNMVMSFGIGHSDFDEMNPHAASQM